MSARAKMPISPRGPAWTLSRLASADPPAGVPPTVWEECRAHRIRAVSVRRLLNGLSILMIVGLLLFPDRVIHAPLFLKVAPLTALLAVSVVARRWKSSSRKSLFDELSKVDFRACLDCGYLLTGHPDSCNCPECGQSYNREEVERAWVAWMHPRAGVVERVQA